MIDVSYAAADAFIASLDTSSFDTLLMLGVAGSSDSFRLERVARNVTGPTPDVRGIVLPAGAIDDAVPGDLPTTLWDKPLPEGFDGVFSDDAGDYLCNYLYFRALQRLPARRVGFLHVPPIEVMRSEIQLSHFRRLLRAQGL